MMEWICKNTTLQGVPFSDEGYEFQRKIADDMHPNLTCIKCSQVGLTEVQIRKALGFLIRNAGTSLIFSLPTEDMYERVSKTRVKPIVDGDKVFNRWNEKQMRSMDLMQFDKSYLYLTAALETAATSIPADAVFNDELDLSNQSIVGLFSSRMQNSKYKINQRFSTPTWPEFGVDLEYKSSDQMMYLCRCKSCNHWNHPEFTRDFIEVPGIPDDIIDLTMLESHFQDRGVEFHNAYVKCERCHNRLDLDDLSCREWVPAFPSRQSMRGYRVTPFATSKLDPNYIFTSLFKFQLKQNMKGFNNTVLGKPYVSGANQLSVEVIENCMLQASPIQVSSDDPVWVGIDIGQTCHIVLTKGYGPDDQKIFMMKAVHMDNLITEVQQILDEYKVIGGIVDYMPYTPTAKQIRDMSQGRIMPVQYAGHQEFKEEIDKVTEKPDHYKVNRTTLIDNFVGKVRAQKIGISGYGHNKEVYIAHLRDMVRDEPEEGQAKWVKLSGNDHYFHASVYAYNAHKLKEAMDKFSKADVRSAAIMIVVNPDGSVMTGLNGLPDKGLVQPNLIGYR